MEDYENLILSDLRSHDEAVKNQRKDQESGKNLLNKIRLICLENKIPFLHIDEDQNIESISLHKMKYDDCGFDELLQDMHGVLPDTVFYENFSIKDGDFKKTKIFCTLNKLSRLIYNDEADSIFIEKIKFHEEIFDVFRYGVCGYKVYLIFSGRVFLLRLGMSGLFETDMYCGEDEIDDEDYNEEDELLEQQEYERSFEEARLECEKYARELSQEKRLMIARNYEQRYAVAKDFFGDRISEIKVSIDAVVREAVNIFELEVLPNLVKDLKEQGKTQKQVADGLGISLAKAKKIFAIV